MKSYRNSLFSYLVCVAGEIAASTLGSCDSRSVDIRYVADPSETLASGTVGVDDVRFTPVIDGANHRIQVKIAARVCLAKCGAVRAAHVQLLHRRERECDESLHNHPPAGALCTVSA